MYKVFVELLDKNNKTAYQVSKDTGISTATLTEWKNGTYTPKIDKIMKIAEYFNVPIETFLNAQKEE